MERNQWTIVAKGIPNGLTHPNTLPAPLSMWSNLPSIRFPWWPEWNWKSHSAEKSRENERKTTNEKCKMSLAIFLPYIACSMLKRFSAYKAARPPIHHLKGDAVLSQKKHWMIWTLMATDVIKPKVVVGWVELGWAAYILLCWMHGWEVFFRVMRESLNCFTMFWFHTVISCGQLPAKERI